MRVMVLVYLSILFMIMFASQTLYQDNIAENKSFDIYNFTENEFVWNYTRPDSADNFTSLSLNYSEIQSKRIKNIVYKSIDWLGYIYFEMSKWAIEFGYTYPEYNFGFFAKICLLVLTLSLFKMIFPILILLFFSLYLLIKKIYSYIRKKRRGL